MTLFLFIALAFILLGLFFSLGFDDVGPLVICGCIGLFILTSASFGFPHRVERHTVDFEVEQTTFEVFVNTKYGRFSSDKKVDFDNWTKEKTGVVIVRYNWWGKVLDKSFDVCEFDEVEEIKNYE